MTEPVFRSADGPSAAERAEALAAARAALGLDDGPLVIRTAVRHARARPGGRAATSTFRGPSS